MHAPALARIIVERAVLGAAVVPDCQRTDLPAELAGELRLNGMDHEKIENRSRLDAPEALERLSVTADVERRAAGLGMGAHQRMRALGLQVARLADLGGDLVVAGVAALPRRADRTVAAQRLAIADIPGLDSLEQLFHRIGQRLVSEIHIGKQRIAGGIGGFLGIEYGRLRGLRIEHLVGVPDLAERSGVALFLDDFEDLGMFVHAFHEGVMVDLAETLGKDDLLLWRDVLPAEKHHQMLEPGGRYFLERPVVHVAEIDAGDFGAERSCDRLDLEAPIGCHGSLLRSGMLQEATRPVNEPPSLASLARAATAAWRTKHGSQHRG